MDDATRHRFNGYKHIQRIKPNEQQVYAVISYILLDN